MSLTAFLPRSTSGDLTTSTSSQYVAIPSGASDVQVVASVDTWIAFGIGNSAPAAGAAGSLYIPAKVPMLFSLNPAWTAIACIAGGAGKCNFAFGAQA